MIYLALGLCFLLYIPALKNKFIVDDLAVLDATERLGVERPKNILKRLWMMLNPKESYYWYEDGWLIHLVALVQHFTVCLMIYFAFGQNNISLWASILFAIHPGNTENAIGISAKGYTTTTFFVLLAWAIPAFTVLYPFQFFMFINAACTPVMFLFKPGYELLALVGLLTLYKWAKIALNPEKNAKIEGYKYNQYIRKIDFGKVIVMLKFYGYYLFNSITANNCAFYHGYMWDFADSKEGIERGRKPDLYFLVGLIGLLVLSFVIFDNTMFRLGLAWATINILMWCNLISTGQMYIANRYNYLPNVGICLMMSALFQSYPAMLFLLAGWYARKLSYMHLAYKDPFWQFEFQLIEEPDYWQGWIHRGNLEYHKGNFKAAMCNYQNVLTLDPNNFKAMFNMNSAELARGQIKSSAEWFAKAAGAETYGQEHRKKEVLDERLALIKHIQSEVKKGNRIRLKTNDIPVLA